MCIIGMIYTSFPTRPHARSPRGYSVNLWVEMCRRDAETLTLQKTMISSILQPYSTLGTKKLLPYPRLAILWDYKIGDRGTSFQFQRKKTFRAVAKKAHSAGVQQRWQLHVL